MKEIHLVSLPTAALTTLTILVGMPLLAHLQPKLEESSVQQARPALYAVSGRVLFEGEPLVNATVLFQKSIDAAGYDCTAMSKTDEKGHFCLRALSSHEHGLAAGDYFVTVEKMVPTGRIIPGTAYQGGNDFPDFPGVQEMDSAIPRRFSNTAAPRLFATVRPSVANVFVIRLTKHVPGANS